MKLDEQTVEQLLESEERLQAFMQHTPALAFMKDADGRYVYVNARMEKALGIRLAEVAGKADFDWLPPAIARQVRKNDELVLKEGQRVEFVESAVDHKGRLRHWMIMKFPFTNARGERFVGGVAIDVSARVEAEEVARRREEEMRALLEHTPDLVVRFDRSLRIVFANSSAAAAVSQPVETLVGKNLEEIGIPPDQRQMLDSTLTTVFATQKEAGFEGRFAVGERTRYFHVRVVPELGAEGGCSTVLMASRDVTRLKKAEKRLIDSERRYRLLFENNLGLMCTHDLEGRLLSVNRAAAVALGYEPPALIGQNLGDFLSADVRHQYPDYLGRVRTKGADEGLLKLVARDGSIRIWKYCNTVMEEPGEDGYVLGSAHDVTELKEAQDAARRLSLTDELTGLVNRRGFMTLAEQHLRLMRRTSGLVLLLYADLDGLKSINDRFGHAQGSAAIRAVAEVMQKTFRRTDIIARVGGDEFVVLVIEPRRGDERVLPRRLARNLREHNRQRSNGIDVTISVGTSLAQAQPGVSLEQLINEADAAMYQRKHAARTA
jgi:diguanylate cyclase (GGDEF)-like protein/PAS domain S-box-containing protein